MAPDRPQSSPEDRVRKAGGLSAILFGITISAAILLYLPALTSVPAGVYEPSNFQARLAYAASLSQPQKTFIYLFASLQIIPSYSRS